MTQVFWSLPALLIRDSSRAKKAAGAPRGRPPRKYDHWRMLQDRMSGMSWSEVEAKHGIPCRSHAGHNAWAICARSEAVKHLKPHEVAVIFPRSSAAAKAAF